MEIHKHGKLFGKRQHFICEACGCEYSEEYAKCTTMSEPIFHDDGVYRIGCNCPECRFFNERELDLKND